MVINKPGKTGKIARCRRQFVCLCWRIDCSAARMRYSIFGPTPPPKLLKNALVVQSGTSRCELGEWPPAGASCTLPLGRRTHTEQCTLSRLSGLYIVQQLQELISLKACCTLCGPLTEPLQALERSPMLPQSGRSSLWSRKSPGCSFILIIFTLHRDLSLFLFGMRCPRVVWSYLVVERPSRRAAVVAKCIVVSFSFGNTVKRAGNTTTEVLELLELLETDHQFTCKRRIYECMDL